jgi:hypothetical protein
MREWWDEWYNKYAAIALVVAGGYGGYHAYCWSNLTSSDWGTWFGAIFTALAFGGTIFLATKESRDRSREQWDTAVVLAAGILERIVAIQNAIKGVDQSIEAALEEIRENADPQTHAATHFLDFAGRVHKALAECPKITVEELKGIVILPEQCAGHLAATAQRIEMVSTDARKIYWGAAPPGLNPIAYLFGTQRNLAACKISLRRAERVCRKAIAGINADLVDPDTAKAD